MKKLLLAAASTGVFLLAACSNDSKDFKENAEDYIESTEIESQLDETFTDTVCTEPAKVEAGETFTCTSVDADGARWSFDGIVRSENSYEVTNAFSFRKFGEVVITSPDVAADLATTFTDALCTEPAQVAVGETYTCTAVDAAGTAWDFTLTLTAENDFEITDAQPRV